MPKYRWNARKCAQNIAALALVIGTGLLIGWIFAQWALA